MKRILMTALITSLAIVLLLLALFTYWMFRHALHPVSSTDPDYVIAEEEENFEDDMQNASGDASPAESDSRWGEFQPTSLAAVDMSVFSAGTILPFVDEDFLDQYFMAYDIDQKVFDRINGKSYIANSDISIEELAYVKVIHYNFEHQTQVGELIVARSLAEDVCEIFQELYEREYEIYSLYLVDCFWKEDAFTADAASEEANNSSAFSYRNVRGTDVISNHALGLAIDINPIQNPYVTFADGEAVTDNPDSVKYLDRGIDAAHVITEEDDAYQVFTAHGFTWGGSWSNVKDYMHFERIE